MAKPHWHIFEWDDPNKKNGNVQHLRDRGIEPEEAEECFFHEFRYSRDYRRFDDVYPLEGRTARGRKLTIVFQDKAMVSSEYLLGIEEKEMKKQFAKLSKTEQVKVEAWYHEQNPEGFDDIMRRAETHNPDIIRLPPQLTARLKTLAKREGEPEYQTMVTRWLKERVQKETRAASKSSKKSERNRGSGLKRQATK